MADTYRKHTKENRRSTVRVAQHKPNRRRGKSSRSSSTNVQYQQPQRILVIPIVPKTPQGPSINLNGIRTVVVPVVGTKPLARRVRAVIGT